MEIKQKALHFLTALTDVYRDEERRELEAFDKLELSDDMTDDVTAMLVAMHFMMHQLLGYDGDMIDFTHMLNKLAFQYLMDGREQDGDD